MFSVDSGNYASAAGSFRAPIFYDSNDTGYYVNPNTNSILNQLGVGSNNTGYTFYNNGTSYLNGAVTIDDTASFTAGNQLLFYTSAGSLRGYINATDTDDNHFQIATSGGEDIVFKDSGLSGTRNLVIRGNNVGTEAYGSMRSPIFYDSNNTAYYTDPNGNSVLTTAIFYVNGSSDITLTAAGTNASMIKAGSGDELYVGGNNTWQMRFSGANVLMDNGGYLLNGESIRSPIFYDSADTAYYVNANGSSYLYGIVLSGAMYFRPNTWIQCDTSAGIYWPNHYGAHFYPNGSSTYTQLQIDGSKNSYSGMYISHSAVNGMMYDSAGNGGVYREANGRWYFYHHVGNNCMGVGSSTTSSTYGIYVVKGGYFDGRVDGTIFYDANNTGYYLDPTSTTSIRTVGSWRADSASWDGEFSGKIQYHSTNWYFQYAGSMLFRNSGGSNVFTVDQSGNAVASGNVTAYSDARIKENVITIDSALDKVLNLRGVYYNKIGNPERRVGVIAQEIETVLPEVVRSVSDTNPSTGQTQELLAVDYGNIAGLLIEATKEQNKEVVDLRAKVERLESLISKLIDV
jgi:hypothetical protein